jgi:hypothetical protein
MAVAAVIIGQVLGEFKSQKRVIEIVYAKAFITKNALEGVPKSGQGQSKRLDCSEAYRARLWR